MNKILDKYYLKEKIIKAIRDFFYRKNFHEIIAPVLNQTIPNEPNLYPFVTEWKTVDGVKKLYLSTSPEKSIKKMLGMGLGNCFSIGQTFRNLENSGSLHTPEFLMLEWYRKKADYTKIMQDCQELFLFINEKNGTLKYRGLVFDLEKKWPKLSLIDLFKKYSGLELDFLVNSDDLMIRKAKEKKYNVETASWSSLFDQIFVQEIEPRLPKTPFFLIDFPTRLSPLCTPKKDNPDFAERFELYIAGIELGNGNTENTNVKAIKNIFQKDIENKKKQGIDTPELDWEFLNSLKKMQRSKYAGIGLGIDRLTMLFANESSIS